MSAAASEDCSTPDTRFLCNPTANVSEQLEFVFLVLKKFYKNPTKENQEVYERLLTSDLAWNLCPLMLDPKSTDHTVQFFGASVLFSRIARYGNTISFEHRVSLRSTLVQYIGRYAFDEKRFISEENSPPRHVYIRLCVTLVRLAMIMNLDGQWPDPIEDLCNILATQTSLDPTVAHQTVCRLMGLFAEEIKAQQQMSALHDAGDGAAHRLARKSADYVFLMIEQNLQCNESELQCLGSWARLGTGLTLFTPSLLDFMFNSLKQTANSDLGEAAADCLSELIGSSVAGSYSDAIWMNKVLPRILSLKPAITYGRSLSIPVDDQMMDYLVRVAKVFTQFVEHHASRIMKPECAVTTRMAVFNFISDCISFPGQFPIEERISELTLSSLYAIADELCLDDEFGVNSSFDEDALWNEENPSEPTIQLTSFADRKVKDMPTVEEARDFFVKFVREMIRKACYPRDHRLLIGEELELFRVYRINICDIVSFSISILQQQCYDVITEQMGLAISSKNWPLQESCLNLLGSLIEQEDFNESRVVNWLLAILPGLNFEIDDRFLTTGLTFAGQLAESVIGNQRCFDYCAAFCIRHMLKADMTCHATISLSSMVRENRELILGPCCQSLVNACAMVVNNKEYGQEDKARCMSIVGYALSTVDDIHQLVSCFDAVLTPFVFHLTNKLQQIPAGQQIPPSVLDQVMADFSLISSFVSSFTSPFGASDDDCPVGSSDGTRSANCYALMSAIYPILTAIIGSENCLTSMFEKCMDILLRFMSYLGSLFEPFLPNIVDIVVGTRDENLFNQSTLSFVRQVVILFYPAPSRAQSPGRPSEPGRQSGQREAVRLFVHTLEVSLRPFMPGAGDASRPPFDGDYLSNFMMFVLHLARLRRSVFVEHVSERLFRQLLDGVLYGMQQNEQCVVKQCAEAFNGLMRFDRGRSLLPAFGQQLCQLLLRTMLLKTPMVCIDYILRSFLVLTKKEHALPIAAWMRLTLAGHEFFRATNLEKEKIILMLTREGTKAPDKCLKAAMQFAQFARSRTDV